MSTMIRTERPVQVPGRALRRWNIVDAMAGLLIIALLCSAYAAFQVASGKWCRHPIRRGQFPLHIRAIFVGVPSEVAKLVQPGDVEIDAHGRVIAKLVEVGAPQPETVLVRYGDRDWVKEVSNPSSGLVDVPVVMWIDSELRGDALYFKNRFVASGTRIGFTTQRYHIDATIYDEAWVQILVMADLPAQEILRLHPRQVETDFEDKTVTRLLEIVHISPEGVWRNYMAAYQAWQESEALRQQQLQQQYQQQQQRQQQKTEKKMKKGKPAGPSVISPAINDMSQLPVIPRIDPPAAPYPFQMRMWVEARCQFVRGVLRFKGNPVIRGNALQFRFSGQTFYGVVDQFKQTLDVSRIYVQLRD